MPRQASNCKPQHASAQGGGKQAPVHKQLQASVCPQRLVANMPQCADNCKPQSVSKVTLQTSPSSAQAAVSPSVSME
eukprot:1157771-Pelagomonas_calceolata.AAC.5